MILLRRHALSERDIMDSKGFLTREEVRDVYDKQAGIYDLAVWFYYLAGARTARAKLRLRSAPALRPQCP